MTKKQDILVLQEVINIPITRKETDIIIKLIKEKKDFIEFRGRFIMSHAILYIVLAKKL